MQSLFFTSTFVPTMSRAYFYILRRRLPTSIVMARKGNERGRERERVREREKREAETAVRNIISPFRRIFNFLESSVKLKRILREWIRFTSSLVSGFFLTKREKPCYDRGETGLFPPPSDPRGDVSSIWVGAFCLPKRRYCRWCWSPDRPRSMQFWRVNKFDENNITRNV